MRFRPSFRRLVVLLAALLLALPFRSAAQENDYKTTLTNLLQELHQSYASALKSDSLLANSPERREQFAEIIHSAQEVTILLYTQRPEQTFDMAFALENVDRIHESLQEQIRLSDKYRIGSRSGLMRYAKLGETLQDMYPKAPLDTLPALDSLDLPQPVFEALEEEAEAPEWLPLLDSCVRLTHALTALYSVSVSMAMQDSTRIADAEQRLQQAYEFSQANYAETQKNRYIGGNVNIGHIIKNWDSFITIVKEDLRLRYDFDSVMLDSAESPSTLPNTWSGPVVLTYSVIAVLLLLICFGLAALIRLVVFKLFRLERLRPFKRILSAILAILLFALFIYLIKPDGDYPYWRLAYQLLSRFAWLTIAILVSLLIRIRGDQVRPSLIIYFPTLLLAFLGILMRAIFLPASTVPLVLPPTMLVFIIWQSLVNLRYRTQVSRADLRYMWVSVGIMLAVGILSLAGYSMIGALLLTVWTFQLALLHTITTLYFWMKRYYENRVIRRKARYHEENPALPLENKDAFIEVTWLYDLLRMVVVPLTILWSFPLSILLTSRAYQLSMTGANLMQLALFRREGLEYLNLSNILLILGLFFIFRYVIYLVKALLRVSKLRAIIDKKGIGDVPLKESDVNLSLFNALVSLLGWLLFTLIAFSILHIPTNALTAILTGLAAGAGFALKDLINNFFYGIQLMAGRIRVGDKISCDGVRGIVKRVSYQTTQVEDEDGSLIAFTNTDLFSRRFRNLNSGKNYELLKLPVSVSYGTDVAFARKVILEAMQPLLTKDKTGRDIVDPSFPIDVRFDGFGDSSVNLIVAFYSTVETHYTFPARTLEAIYNAFYENGIQIPFPQRDLYLKTIPEALGNGSESTPKKKD